MSKLSAFRRGSSTLATHKSALPGDDVLYLCSTDWVAALDLESPCANSMIMSLTLSPHSMSHLTQLTPHSQSSQLDLFPDMPVPTFEYGHYTTVNSQLPWSAEYLTVPPLYHDVSSQSSSPEGRLPSESPSFQDAEGDADTPSAATATEEPKRPKRSRPNRYKNGPPAVIQRRRAANRKSQQAYRKRKDDRIAELEELLDQSARREQDMSRAYMTLRAEYEQLLMLSGGGGRSPSIANTCAEEKAASAFLALAAFAQQPGDGGGGSHGLSPRMVNPQHPQQPASCPHLLSVYPPPLM